MNFWTGTLVGLLIGAPVGAYVAYLWPRHRQPLGTADAPVDKVLRRVGTLPLRGVLVGLSVVAVVSLVLTLVVLTADWNQAKDAARKADRAYACQQFNDRESSAAQIRAARANIQLRNDQVAFLTSQRDFLTVLPAQPGGSQELAAQKFREYLQRLSDQIESLRAANRDSAELISALEERDIGCVKESTGIGR